MVDRGADLTAHNSTSSCYTQTCHRTSPGWTLCVRVRDRERERAANTTPNLFSLSYPLSLSSAPSLSPSLIFSYSILLHNFWVTLVRSPRSCCSKVNHFTFRARVSACVRIRACVPFHFSGPIFTRVFFQSLNFFSLTFLVNGIQIFLTCVSVTYVKKEEDKQKTFVRRNETKSFFNIRSLIVMNYNVIHLFTEKKTVQLGGSLCNKI